MRFAGSQPLPEHDTEANEGDHSYCREDQNPANINGEEREHSVQTAGVGVRKARRHSAATKSHCRERNRSGESPGASERGHTSLTSNSTIRTMTMSPTPPLPKP